MAGRGSFRKVRPRRACVSGMPRQRRPSAAKARIRCRARLCPLSQAEAAGDNAAQDFRRTRLNGQLGAIVVAIASCSSSVARLSFPDRGRPRARATRAGSFCSKGCQGLLTMEPSTTGPCQPATCRRSETDMRRKVWSCAISRPDLRRPAQDPAQVHRADQFEHDVKDAENRSGPLRSLSKSPVACFQAPSISPNR